MKVCIAGKNQIAIDGLLMAIDAYGVENVFACTNDSDDGNSKWQPSLIRYAKEYGVEIKTLPDLFDLKELVFISLEFDKIIKPEMFRSNSLFNIHFSKLPAYKGMYTSAWPILNGETESGVTLHKIDSGIDTGDIISQNVIKLNDKITARDLYFEYQKSAKNLLKSSLDMLVENRFQAQTQESVNSTYFSKKSINYLNLCVNTNMTAQQIIRQVNAFQFREFQIPSINGIQVNNGIILNSRSPKKPGELLINDSDHIVISTIDYDVLFEVDKSWAVFECIEENTPSEIISFKDRPFLLDMTNKYGWTPIMVGAFSGNYEVCRELINVNADIKKQNTNGTSALMYAKEYAIKTGDFSICKLLIDNGADIYIKDAFGKSVVDYCKSLNQIPGVNFFNSIGRNE